MEILIQKELKAFDIHINCELTKGIRIVDLLDKRNCISFLEELMIEINAPNLSVTASMLAKRYAFLVVSSSLFTMAEYNSALSLPVDACTLSTNRHLYIQSNKCKWQEVKTKEREQWREVVLRDLFSSHITPFIETLNKSNRIPLSILWENTAVRINSVYRKALARDLPPIKTERINSDFNFLKNAPGELFDLKENPISSYLKIGEELKNNPYRKTCCLYYKLKEDAEGINHCSNCLIIGNKTKQCK